MLIRGGSFIAFIKKHELHRYVFQMRRMALRPSSQW